MKGETVLLLGGKNKGYDYTPLFAALKNSSVVHAVLYGENRYALLKCAREQSFGSVSLCDKFAFAVRIAKMVAKRGQIVLLSPASASFDEFTSYEERGDTFVEMVRNFAQNNTQNTTQNTKELAIEPAKPEPFTATDEPTSALPCAEETE